MSRSAPRPALPSSRRTARRVTLLLPLLTLLLAAVTAITGSGAASAVAVPPTPKLSASIEPQRIAYVPQVGCDRMWKKGTRYLVGLLKRTYPDIYAQGEYKCGTDGSVSEHYEGRAIDWMTSAKNAHQKAEAVAFIHWLLATDKWGHKYAMARRLGVMYLVWNNRIWGGWDGQWHPYQNCAQTTGAAYDNACHRTHVHISLTWNGAIGRTTYWNHHVVGTDYGICTPRAKYTGFRATPCKN